MPNSHQPATPDADLTVLSFSAEDDHCHYDAKAIFDALSSDDQQIVKTLFSAGDIASWDTSIGLYVAVDELYEVGHHDLACHLEGYIHAEQVYACRCRDEALTAFKDKADTLLSAIESRAPHGTWWTPQRTHAHGLDINELLEDANFHETESNAVRLAVDPLGNGALTVDGTKVPIVGFTTPELGIFVQHLDAGEIDASYGPVDHNDVPLDVWLAMPGQKGRVIASLWVHDIVLGAALLGDKAPLGAGRVRARQLALDQLELAANAVTELPTPLAEALVAMLADTPFPGSGRAGPGPVLDDLINAMKASCLAS